MTPTPQQFVEIVEPYFKAGRIGPYTGVRFAPDCGGPSATRFRREVHLSRADGHGSHFDTGDAARLLLGAVVEEACWHQFCQIDGETICRFDPYNEVLYRGAAPGTDLYAKLRAALSARAAAKAGRA